MSKSANFIVVPLRSEKSDPTLELGKRHLKVIKHFGKGEYFAIILPLHCPAKHATNGLAMSTVEINIGKERFTVACCR